MRRAAAITAVCLAGLVGSYLWFEYSYLARSDVGATLTKRASGDSGRPIDISDLPPSSWNRVVLVGPYNSRTEVERALGFSWPQYEHFGIEMSDSRSLIVLADARQVISVGELRRCLPDIDNGIQSKPIARDHAIFRAVNRNGCITLVQANAKAP
jgi:hypothetical protein